MGSLLFPGTVQMVSILLASSLIQVSFLCEEVSSFAHFFTPVIGGDGNDISCSSLILPSSSSSSPLLLSRKKQNRQRRRLVITGNSDDSGGTKATVTRLSLFGNIFGNNDDKSDNKNENELAIHRGLLMNKDENDADATFDSLSSYIKSWSKLFETSGGNYKGSTIKLTTPVKVLPSENNASDENDDDGEGNDNDDAVAVLSTTGIRLVFQNVDTGYKNKMEEEYDQEEKDSNEKGSDDKKKPKLQGGVEILVQKIVVDQQNNDIQVLAKRCNFDDDTIIKEMSEETIIKELGKAISVWKRQQQQ